MAQTTVSIRMDNDLKNSFDHICNELGMSMSTAVTMLAKKMTREQRLPFELSVDPFYSEQNHEENIDVLIPVFPWLNFKVCGSGGGGFGGAGGEGVAAHEHGGCEGRAENSFDFHV